MTVGFSLALIFIDANRNRYCGHSEPPTSPVLNCYPNAQNHLLWTSLALEIPHILIDSALLIFGLLLAMFKNEAQSPDHWDGLFLIAAILVFLGRVAGTIATVFSFAGSISNTTSIAGFGRGMTTASGVFMGFEFSFLFIVLLFCIRSSYHWYDKHF
jgi:hypothetical protein